jgi:hypothetical protein
MRFFLFAIREATLETCLEAEASSEGPPLESGPLLRCEHCNEDFRFTNEGKVLTTVVTTANRSTDGVGGAGRQR